MGNLTHIAGLWAEHLQLTLRWYVKKKNERFMRFEWNMQEESLQGDFWTDEVLEPVERPAPSWSWLAISVYKFFKVGFLFGESDRIIDVDEVYFLAKSQLDPPESRWDDVYRAAARVGQPEHEVSEKIGDGNTYSDFDESCIEILAYANPIDSD